MYTFTFLYIVLKGITTNPRITEKTRQFNLGYAMMIVLILLIGIGLIFAIISIGIITYEVIKSAIAKYRAYKELKKMMNQGKSDNEAKKDVQSKDSVNMKNEKTNDAIAKGVENIDGSDIGDESREIFITKKNTARVAARKLSKRHSILTKSKISSVVPVMNYNIEEYAFDEESEKASPALKLAREKTIKKVVANRVMPKNTFSIKKSMNRPNMQTKNQQEVKNKDNPKDTDLSLQRNPEIRECGFKIKVSIPPPTSIGQLFRMPAIKSSSNMQSVRSPQHRDYQIDEIDASPE